MDFLIPLKTIYRLFFRLVYRKSNVRIERGVLFNNQSRFDINIRIRKGSWVSGSIIGRNTYLDYSVKLPYSTIGNFCSIASNVEVIMATHPTKKYVSTSPVFYSTKKQCGFTYTKKTTFKEHLLVEGRSVIIGNDVWIGQDVKILGGVRIGDGAIIAMGAVVTKDVEPFSIVGGVPAKCIRKRFDEAQIQVLQEVKWWLKPDDWIKDYIDEFEDIERFIDKANQHDKESVFEII